MNPTRLALRTLGKRLPVTQGSIALDGVTDTITIRRDRFGVPHIEAGNEGDVWFGIGFCHGQDRTFQLETRLRLVRGTLSEIFGSDTIPIDELSRRIGFRRHGERLLDELLPEHRSVVLAYAAGVRDGVDHGLRRRPHEFVLLRSRPSSFEAADALGLVTLQAFALASNWDAELARLSIASTDGVEAAIDLDPTYPPDLPTSIDPLATAGDMTSLAAAVAADLRRLAATTGWLGGGSNNWAVAGSRTTSGRPMLANDPHLAPILPAHWYLVDGSCPEWRIVGASLPGAPVFGAGHNGHAAWGVTAGLTDTTDLFLEDMGPDGVSVRRGDQYVECEQHTERITVRGADDVVFTRLQTDRGPIVGPAFEGAPAALSMAATWLRPEPVSGFFEIPTITTFAEFRRAFAAWPAVPLNVAFADSSGTIAWQLIGDLPVRHSGSGAVPLPAWEPDVGWADDPIRSASLPHLVDPPEGIVVTANNLPAAGGMHLGADFIDGYRAARIAEVLASRRDWDIAGMLALQMDRTSLPWRRLREPLLRALGVAGDLGPLVDVLRSWDGVMAPDSEGATAFALVVAELTTQVARARAPRSSDAALGRGFTPLVPFSGFAVRRVGHLVRLVEEQPAGWFADGWDEAIRSAGRSALGRLDSAAGAGDRAWGRIRPLRLKHPMGLRPPLDRVFDLGPVAHGGDATTVNPAPVDPFDPLSNPDFAIASLRMVIDVGDWEKARFVLPGGQSGNPFSRHYGDQLPVWAQGDAIALPWTDDQIRRTTRSTLVLEPA